MEIQKLKIPALAAILMLLAGAAWYGLRDPLSSSSASMESVSAPAGTVSAAGIHWHPKVTITIKGKKETIPAGIGLGMQYAGHPLYDPMMMMTNVHTHDESGELHWEVMEGPVREDDVRLGQFFAVWGKKFTSECIYDYCNGPDGTLTLKVGGADNRDFENYLVKDKDTIEIIYQ